VEGHKTPSLLLLKMKKTFKQDKGQAGLTILLSVIVMLFMIGLLVSIFSIMGGELQTSSYTASTGSATNQTTSAKVTEKGFSLPVSTLRDVVCSGVVFANYTVGLAIPTTNYTVSNCAVTVVSGTFNNTYWNATYSYTWSNDNTATNSMNETVASVGGVASWFNIFIVITAMVVLILLTVIIITSIRSSGMVGGMGGSGANQVGTA